MVKYLAQYLAHQRCLVKNYFPTPIVTAACAACTEYNQGSNGVQACGEETTLLRYLTHFLK